MEHGELRQNESYIFKDFHYRWAKRLQELKRYAVVGFRKSMKSTMLRLRAMWKAYRLMRGEDNPEYEARYLSAKEDLAAYHTSKLNQYIRGSPLFKDAVHETDAESVIKMRFANKKRCVISPGGILAAHRGMHPDEVFVDDVLGDVADPSIALDITMINKITDRMLSVVQFMPRHNGPLFVWGTPQTDSDIFAVYEGSVSGYERELEGQHWVVERVPIEDAKGRSIMPERYPNALLSLLRGAEGSRQWLSYQKEMLVRPVHQVFRTFLPKGLIEACIMPETPFEEPAVSIGGLDMGKHKHPGHLVFFVPHNGRMRQILSKWFDGCEYREMVAEASRYAEFFNSIQTYVDNTRADYEGFDEQGYVLMFDRDEMGEEIPETKEIIEIHPSLTPIPLTTKTKWAMGQRMRMAMESKKLGILGDTRQKRQLLLVDQHLKAAETVEGHGEPFTSIGLSVLAAYECGFLRDETQQEPERMPTEQEMICNAFAVLEQSIPQTSGQAGTVRL